jgi:drug/metabolite transporter (DMT)-like permease
MPESPSAELAESKALASRRSASRALWDRAAGNAYLLLIPTMMMWGANAVAGRLAVGRVSPMALVTLRWVIAAVILLAEAPMLRRLWRPQPVPAGGGGA